MNQRAAGCPDLLRDWLKEAVGSDASDLHLVTGYPPVLRMHGELRELDAPKLEHDGVHQLLEAAASESALGRFASEKNTDFCLELSIDDSLRRFRANYFLTGGNIGACFRVIPMEIPDLAWAGFPFETAERLSNLRNGLVLLTGITGSGKTTTLAMIINLINQEGGRRIVTVEEPIEYIYPKMPNSVITQRELGEDVLTFSDGLKYGLRQDPDVILVGEIRDRETAQMALSAAETGHLVFSTLHTRDVKGAVSRYADLFPQSVQSEIRSQLSVSLKAIISQHLLPNADPTQRRKLALEVMFNNAPIASGIRTGKLLSIDNYILSGRDQGMLTLNESVTRLLQSGQITQETADRFLGDSFYN
ncbi:MAG: type IV pili twitching motility protein PilT [Planctomycetaceae bacterium]|nr:type IV pili twitching motility protein PilT [Planctomycetaceae bacterium]